jgi:acyl-coenzyme A thioesterase PaaI-like protein
VGLVHHELCFGCGTANLFGLQLELDPVVEGVAGRFFVKQDHQGPPGSAHGGILASALDEAMSLAVHSEGIDARTRSIALELNAPAPVGTFVRVTAQIDGRGGRRIEVSSSATGDDERPLAEARATFVRIGEGEVAEEGAAGP